MLCCQAEIIAKLALLFSAWFFFGKIQGTWTHNFYVSGWWVKCSATQGMSQLGMTKVQQLQKLGYCLTPDSKPAGSVIYSNTPLILILVNSLTRIQTNINWTRGSILIHDFKTYNLPNLIKIMYFIQIKVDTSFFFVKNLI